MSRSAESALEEYIATKLAEPGYTVTRVAYSFTGTSSSIRVGLGAAELCSHSSAEGLTRMDYDLNISELKLLGGRYLLPEGRKIVMPNGKKITFTEDCVINELKLHSSGALKIVTPLQERDFEVETDWNYPREADAHNRTSVLGSSGDCYCD